jgi:hypothetical protein
MGIRFDGWFGLQGSYITSPNTKHRGAQRARQLFDQLGHGYC